MGLNTFPQPQFNQDVEPKNSLGLPTAMYSAMVKVTEKAIEAIPPYVPPVTVPYNLNYPVAGNWQIDYSISTDINANMTEDVHFQAPTNPQPFEKMRIYMIQDAVGGWVATWDPVFVFTPAIPVPVLSVTPFYIDYIEFIYHEGYAKWYCINFVPGLAP